MLIKEQVDSLRSFLSSTTKDKQYWFFRTMGGYHFDEFVSKGFIALGYDFVTMKELSSLPEDGNKARMAIKAVLEPFTKEYSKKRIGTIASQVVRFYQEMQIGDVVIVPSEQSQRFAFGIIQSEVYEDGSKHPQGSCQFSKRRKVKWYKDASRYELDPKLILALGSQHTISNVNAYAELIDRKINKLYTKGDYSYLNLRVNQETGLTWDEYIFLGDLGTIFSDFSKENNLGVDLTQIQMKINVQSPGDILMIIPDNMGEMLVIVALLLVAIKGGSAKIKISDAIEAELKTKDVGSIFGNVLDSISNFLNQRTDRKIKVAESKARLQKMEMELPEVIKDVIVLDEQKTEDHHDAPGSSEA
ncbi:MAG: hypothetical protein IKH86_03195 [Prevotella sp.]|nr:hypothetical protein [Prevotella sp.]